MDLTNEDRGIVIAAIRRNLSADVEIFLFGSRVNGSSNKGSDLDVLLKGKASIDLGLLALLKEELEESALPFKVDILDYHSCSKEMLKNISADMVKI